MIRQLVRFAWLLFTGQPFRVCDTEGRLVKAEESREVWEPHDLSRTRLSPPAGAGPAAADHSPPAGGGHPSPITACGICGEPLICRLAAEEFTENK